MPARPNPPKNAARCFIQMVDFRREKDDELDKEHDALMAKLRLLLEYYNADRGYWHPYLGALYGLKRGSEDTLIKLHDLIGRYKELPEDDARRIHFFRRLKCAQRMANRHVRRALVWPHEEAMYVLASPDSQSTRFYAYRYVDDLELPSRYRILTDSPALTKPPTDWPFPKEKTGLVAPPIPPNDQLRAHRAQAAIYNPWVGTHPDEIEANANLHNKGKLGQKIRDFFAKMKTKRADKAQVKADKKGDDAQKGADAQNGADAAANGAGPVIPEIQVGNTDGNQAADNASSVFEDIHASVGNDAGTVQTGLNAHPVRRPVDE
ncbi:uncharacterized protein B0I36DRAFT_369269 [Microdochium trichocladiopsis]|uniref:Uncharacterized protein n=1 Tax=Microdochium trichocladiopsis TaxID=1682393 RepID=A0A9P9BID6_9PEZI|nr:uncharacterized protein B0I36DRAFT_369269 [Microdochium trichocladiopsis]KAH7014298.1 hypothetical protein B0I36DRAFT_369269 [Microdochium trichocladiopsis]